MAGVRILDHSANGLVTYRVGFPLVPGKMRPLIPFTLKSGNRYRIMNLHVEEIRSALSEDVLLTTIFNVTTGQREVEIRHNSFADLAKFEDAFNALCDDNHEVCW